MVDIQDGTETPKQLLARAYALKNPSEAAALYRDWASTYDHTMLEGLGYQTPKLTAKLLATALESDEANILDVGSGTGLAGLELARLGYARLDALDLSPEMLEIARHRNVYSNLIEADLNKPLSIKSGSYDALICTGTFTHAHVSADALDELFRILKSDGLFACTVHKDVWENAGFAAKTAELEANTIMTRRYCKSGKYYQTSTKPEGWYLLWQKI